MFWLAYLFYGDRGKDLCCDSPGSQESAPELGVGCAENLKVGVLGAVRVEPHSSSCSNLDP